MFLSTINNVGFAFETLHEFDKSLLFIVFFYCFYQSTVNTQKPSTSFIKNVYVLILCNLSQNLCFINESCKRIWDSIHILYFASD